MTTYVLDNSFAQRKFTVTIVGCGGTGGFAADGLCRILPDNAQLVLVDHARVEERNLVRQNFLKEEIGSFKSEALSHRLARKYGRPVAYTTSPIAMVNIEQPGLIIGCVDSGPARRHIANKFKGIYQDRCWWIDAGNGDNFGQILIGNSEGSIRLSDEKEHRFHSLPLPTIQRPELLTQVPSSRNSCANISDQGPTINQMMAVLVVEVVRRLIKGTCSWFQLYLDLENGTLRPVLASPEILKEMFHIKEEKHERN